jgi:hypothetical protein
MTELDDAEQREMLDSLLEIGPSRPLIILEARSAPEILAVSALAQGLAAVQFPRESCSVEGGALYVYHRAALGALLQAHSEAVLAVGLPLQSDAFVARIATVRFAPDHPAHKIIAAALGRTVE